MFRSFVIGVIAIYLLTYSRLEQFVLRHYVSFLLLLCIAFNSEAFGSFSLKFSSIEIEGISVDDVAIHFTWVDIDHVDLALAFGHSDTVFAGEFDNVQVMCRNANFNGQTILCTQGEISLQHQDLGRLQGSLEFTYQLPQGLLSLALQLKLDSEGEVLIKRDQTAQGLETMLHLKGIEVTRFQRLLEQYAIFRGHTLTTGILDSTVKLISHEDDVSDINANVHFSDLGIDGENILEGLTITSQISAKRKGEVWKINTNTLLQQGAMYITPGIEVMNDRPGFYIEVLDKPISIQADVQWQAENKRLKINNLLYEHPGYMTLQLSSSIALQEKQVTESMLLDIRIQDLASAFPVYIEPLLLQTYFNDMETAGAVDLHLAYNNDVLEKFTLKMDDVFVDDNSERYSLSGISGKLSLSDQADPILSELYWKGLSFYRLGFGSGSIKFESQDKNIRIIDWQDVDILDGTLLIKRLSLNNVGTDDFEFLLDGSLTAVSMQAFTQAVGWPLLTGKLFSTVAGFKYRHNSLQIDSDIEIQIFNGDIVLKNFRIDDIFSDVSILTTDITVDKLDLEQLTDTFSFGKIEGNLSGKISGLKLEDWQPVYFEAEFASPEHDEKPHRISQKALENLNQIGSGLSGTLSSGFLKLFPSYAYGRIGISCRLFNGICELGGVADSRDGFYLLTRGGFLPPWVEVKGTGRSITWAHLITGLKRITEGNVAIE